VPEGFTPWSFLDYGLNDHITGKADVHDKTKTHQDPASARGGYTALLFAARSGDDYSARLLIEAGAGINHSGPDGTALLVAAASGHEHLAVWLAENGADVKARDGFGITALHWAVQEGLASLVAAKIQANTDPLWYHPNMPGLAKALIARGADVNARVGKGIPPWDLPRYAHGGGIALPQIRHNGATAFFLAAAGGDTEMMRLLLASGANGKATTDEGATPLMAAAGVGQLRERAAANKRGAYEATLLAIELGNDVKATAAGNRTALHGAAQTGANDIIELLVKSGANINAKDKYGQTPLSIALGDPERLVDPFDKRFRQQPPPQKAAAALLLSLGATPLANDADKVGAGKVSAPSRYPASGQ
jgi:ankyrin repeat protein